MDWWLELLQTNLERTKVWLNACHTRKIDSGLIWEELMQSVDQFGWKRSPRTVLVALNRFLFSSSSRNNIVICSHLSWTALDTARLKPLQTLFRLLPLLRWSITPWSPLSRRSTAPGAHTRPHKGSCGDTRAAGGLPARWKTSVAVCACWLRTWTLAKGEEEEVVEVWCILSTGCVTCASDVGCHRCVCVTERKAWERRKRGNKCTVIVQERLSVSN